MPYLSKKPLPRFNPCSRLQWSSIGVGVEAGAPIGHFLMGMCSDESGGIYGLTALSATMGLQKSLKVARVNASGVVSSRFAVDTYAGLGTWYEGSIAPGPGQGCFVAWRREQRQLRLARFDGAGNQVWSVNLSTLSLNLQFPAVVPDGGGGAFVAYIESKGVGSNLTRNLMAAHVDGSGAIVWQGIVSVLASGVVSMPRGVPVLILTKPQTAMVLWQELSSQAVGAFSIEARWLGGAGFGSNTFFVDNTSEAWIEPPTAYRRVAPSLNGEAFISYANTAGKPQVARYAANAIIPAASWAVGTSLMHPAYFSIASDGADGLFVTAINSQTDLDAYHFNPQGMDVWSGIGTGFASLVKPPSAGANRWAHNSLCAIYARSMGEAVVIVSQGSTVAAADRHLEMFCFRATGRYQSPPTVSLLGGSGTGSETIWLGESLSSKNVGVIISKDMAVFAQSLGCCPDEPSSDAGPLKLPEIFCGMPDWPKGLFSGWLDARLVCGLRPRGSIGVLPFGQLAELTPIGLPAGTYLPNVTVPDWVRIRFNHIPADLEIDVYIDGNRRLSRAEPMEIYPVELLERLGRTKIVTFKPQQGRTHYLVFRSGISVDGRKIPLQISAEYGMGKPLPILPPSGPLPKKGRRVPGKRKPK